MPLPLVVEHQIAFGNTSSTGQINMVDGVAKGDVIMVGGDTNNGAQISDMHVGANFTASVIGDVMTVSAVAAGVVTVGHVLTGGGVNAGTKILSLGTGTGNTGTYILDQVQPAPIASEPMTTLAAELTFVRLATGFSLSVWWAKATAKMAPLPHATQSILINYSSAYNTNAILGINVRNTIGFDPNMSLPGIQTGNPHPPAVVFSTSRDVNIVLMWIGCFVGFAVTAPWVDPLIAPPNTVGPGSWDWIDGLNNTSLLQPIALTVYSQVQQAKAAGQSVLSTAPALQGAAYIVTALSGTNPIQIVKPTRVLATNSPGGGGGGVIELEDASGFIELEDGSGFIDLE